MKKMIWVSALILGAGFAGCHNSSSTSLLKSHEFNLKRKCPNTLVMKVGENIIFKAPENPSTGYQWQLMQPVKLFKSEETYNTQITDADEQIVGAGGERVFRFTALKPGYEVIDLAYVRAWEKSNRPEQRWQCHIRIS
ncbi:protease inhibitor I42 family protein [Acinetobacter stercoris]|uniref:Chagasin family peptidase inhibitor I42 n=1 Tax=Acinetobacter stercoris TaxID=2126983 RepID=A0A2U3MWS1_9GAMM|nr:protease inhibitor I42 family protein [Acinetobacter stercoris]SPL69749.1 Chagasin family peptidase inhibitor I42 [Acinetobacter stercoris]